MNSSLILRACLYHIFGGFSDLRDIVNYWDPYFSPLQYDVDSFRHGLDAALAWSGPQNGTPNDRAVWLLARAELEKIDTLLDSPVFVSTLAREINIEASLSHYSEVICDHYRAIGLDIAKPRIEFVDDYPGPSKGKGFMAVTMAPNDLMHFGVPVGIYFKKNALRPFYSVLMLGHEFTHHILNRHSQPYFGGPLEEGIAEFYGAFYLTSKIYSVELATKMFVYHRFFGDINKGMDVYLDYSRLGFSLYNAGGVSAIEELLKGDRELVKETEQRIWQGQFPQATKQVAASSEFDRSANFLFSAVSKLAVCSPLARYLSTFTKAGVSFEEISDASGFSRSDVITGLKELENAPRFVELHSGGVLHSDCERIIHPLQLRYKVPVDAQSVK